MISNDKAIGAASVRLSKKLTRVINIYLKQYHITTEQWSVLRTLQETDHIAQKELSDRADKDQATLTKILDILEKNEFVVRIANPNDRRSYLIMITEKGRELAQEVAPYLEEIFTKIVARIDANHLAIYQEILLSLEKNIDNLLDDATNN